MNNATNYSVRRSAGVRAFTLIELLIVIGLTAVLFALLLVPLVSAIRYTQQAQIVTAAQDAVRITKERLTRELSSAMFVFDGTSHPFLSPTTPLPGDDRYTNFLDLEIPGIDTTTQNYKSAIAHAYAAKLDFVQPRANQGGPEDPTTHEPISYRPTENGSAIISNPAYVFPLASGTTMTRYWIGLKDPTKPYSNTREGKPSGNSTDNTYILYRAQFQPYKPVFDINGKQTGVKANAQLFANSTKKDANGNSLPDLDDPDFFRYVNIKPDGTAGPATDVNWLDDAHATFPAQTAVTSVTDATADGSAAQHNYRVEQWRSIAKPVIPGPNVDLILLPHNADNTLTYDTPTGVFPGVPHSGAARDPLTGKSYPIVNTSVTFRPATVSGDAAPGTTSDYGSQGLPTVSQDTGYGYVPTFYSATSRSWSLPFHVSLYPGNYDGGASPASNTSPVYYDTQISSVTDTSANNYYSAGDVLEYKHASTADTAGTLVYNVTKAYPLKDNGAGSYTLGGTDYVPFTVNPDNGTLNFGTPSLPNGPTDRNQRLWYYAYDGPNQPSTQGGVLSDGTIDLTKLGQQNSSTASPPGPSALTDPLQVPASAPNVRNAHIIPGGIRVAGPDTTPGPNYGTTVPYTEVGSALTETPAGNQYRMDYLHNTVQVSQDTVTYLQQNTTKKVSVVYDYQANMTLADPTKAYSFGIAGTPDNVYLPMQVKLDYQTRDLIDVSIGVRIYDITNNRAQVIPAETKIKIGNSNR